MGIHARRRLLAAGAAAAIVVLAIALLGGGGDGAPPDRAAALVPADALAFVDLSTDGSRDAVRRARSLAAKFPSYRAVRDAVLQRLTGRGCLRAGDMRGGEAALAVLGDGALVLLDTGHEHDGAAPHRCGAVSARYVGRFLAIGRPAVLARVRDLAAGHGAPLAADPQYRRTQVGLPAGRFADGYLSTGGLRGLLAPQAGLPGALGVLLDRPGLTAVGFAAEAGGPGARLTVREVVRGGRAPAAFHPELLGEVPAGALAALDVRDLGSAVRRLGGLIGGLGPVTQRRIAAALGGETVLWLTPATPAPRLTLVTPAGSAHVSALPHTFAGVPLYSAVVGGMLVGSTDVRGIAAFRRGARHPLTAGAAYRSVLSGAPSQVTSLTYLDFSELLRLAEETGLSDSRAYRRIRADLGRVRAVGATSTGAADETTVQVVLSIS